MRVFTCFLFVVLVANFEFAGFRKQKKYTAYDRFHGNGPYGEIPTKKEPIRTLGFTSSLSCHIIIRGISFMHLLMLTPIEGTLGICGALDFPEKVLSKFPQRGSKTWSNQIKYPQVFRQFILKMSRQIRSSGFAQI